MTPELLTQPLVSAYFKLTQVCPGIHFKISLYRQTFLFIALILLSLREYNGLLHSTSTSREDSTCKVCWWLRIFFLFFVVCRTGTETIRLSFFGYQYFKLIDNYFKIFIIAGSLFLVLSTNPDHYPFRKKLVGVLLLVLILDFLKIVVSTFEQDHKITLLIEVIKKFLSYTALYFPLIIICGMSFYVIFRYSTQFSDASLFGIVVRILACVHYLNDAARIFACFFYFNERIFGLV